MPGLGGNMRLKDARVIVTGSLLPLQESSAAHERSASRRVSIAPHSSSTSSRRIAKA